MQMNDIIDGLNSCDCPTGLNTAANYNNASGFGCGFGAWAYQMPYIFSRKNSANRTLCHIGS